MWWDQNPSFPSSFQGPRPSSHLVVSHRLASLPALALGCQAAHPPDSSGRAERHLRHLPWALIRPVSLAAGELRYPLDKVLQNLLVGDDTLAGRSVHPHPANYCCSIGRVRADGASEPRTVGDACVDVPNTRFYSPVSLLACPHRPPIPHFFQVAVLPASNCPLLTSVGGHTAAALRSRSSTKKSPGERPSQETHPRKKIHPRDSRRNLHYYQPTSLHRASRSEPHHGQTPNQTTPADTTNAPHNARAHARTHTPKKPRPDAAASTAPPPSQSRLAACQISPADSYLNSTLSLGSGRQQHHTTAVARRVDESISLSPSLAASGEASFLHRGQGGAMNSTTGRAGVIRARDDAGNMDKLVSPFLPAACGRPSPCPRRHGRHRLRPSTRPSSPAPRRGLPAVAAPELNPPADAVALAPSPRLGPCHPR